MATMIRVMPDSDSMSIFLLLVVIAILLFVAALIWPNVHLVAAAGVILSAAVLTKGG